jgi:hypothetical protein
MNSATRWMRAGGCVSNGPTKNCAKRPQLPREQLIGRRAAREVDLEALETAARRCALRWAAHTLQQQLSQDHGDHGDAALPCSCGRAACCAGG